VLPLAAIRERERVFRSDGYLLLRSAIAGSDANILLAEVERLVSAAVETDSVFREPYYHKNSFKLVRPLRLTTAFDDLIDHPSYFDTLIALMGTHIQVMGAELFIRGSSSHAITALHTDLGPGLQQILPDDENAFLQIKMQLFLTDLSTPNSGNFVLVPRSHRRRVTQSDRLGYVTEPTTGPNVSPTEPIQVLAEPGDVLLFPHSLWHGVAANRTRRTRYSISFRYGQTALRPLERFDPVLVDPQRTLSRRQRRLLGDFAMGDESPYRPSDQDEVMIENQKLSSRGSLSSEV
jgi:hypothetical protein